VTADSFRGTALHSDPGSGEYSVISWANRPMEGSEGICSDWTGADHCGTAHEGSPAIVKLACRSSTNGIGRNPHENMLGCALSKIRGHAAEELSRLAKYDFAGRSKKILHTFVFVLEYVVQAGVPSPLPSTSAARVSY
jgi:hypothetical protein